MAVVSENIFEILTGEEVRTATSFSLADIWEKRPFLSGSADYASTDSMYVDIVREEKSEGEIIENTGVSNPAVEYRPLVKKVEEKKIAHVSWVQTTSAHEYNDLVNRYNSMFRGKTLERGDAKLIDTIKEWSLSIYTGVLKIYVDSCEKGLCQALSYENGWVVPGRANQEPFVYNPGIEHSDTGSILDFDTNDPALKLFYDLVRPAQREGYSPNVILVGDAIAKAILQSEWYSANHRTAPISQSFYFTPKESTVAIKAKGAEELVGITVAGCKVIWIHSNLKDVSLFKPNCAVALNDNQFASIYAGPTFTFNNTLEPQFNKEVLFFYPAPLVNPKEIRFYCEYSYLPAINRPGEIFRMYYDNE